MATTQPQIQVDTGRGRETANLELLSNWQGKGVASGAEVPLRVPVMRQWNRRSLLGAPETAPRGFWACTIRPLLGDLETVGIGIRRSATSPPQLVQARLISERA